MNKKKLSDQLLTNFREQLVTAFYLIDRSRRELCETIDEERDLHTICHLLPRAERWHNFRALVIYLWRWFNKHPFEQVRTTIEVTRDDMLSFYQLLELTYSYLTQPTK